MGKQMDFPYEDTEQRAGGHYIRQMEEEPGWAGRGGFSRCM